MWIVYFDHIHSSLPSFEFIDLGKSTQGFFHFLKKNAYSTEWMFACLSRSCMKQALGVP